MVIKVSIPNRFQFKTIPSFKTMLFQKEGEVHYIGGADILPAPLNSEEEARLIEKLGTAEESGAKSALIEHNLRLVVYIAKKFDNTSVGVEDLISIGTIGLIKAIDTFDEAKGIRLATYASRCIDNELLMLFRSGKKQSHEIYLYDPIGADKEGNTIRLMDICVADEVDLVEQIEFEGNCKKLTSLIEQVLSEREQEILTLRYGLYGKKEVTQREIAEKLQISRSYVSRIEKKALNKLREKFEQG